MTLLARYRAYSEPIYQTGKAPFQLAENLLNDDPYSFEAGIEASLSSDLGVRKGVISHGHRAYPVSPISKPLNL